MEEIKQTEEESLLSGDNNDYLIENKTKSLKCGVSWDFFDTAIDLDVTVVAINNYSLEMDAAYYAQTSILNNAITHSGDNKTGVGDGDDEEIKINLNNLPSDCHSMWFIVNAYSGGTFKDVETAKFTLYDDDNKQIYSYQITMAGINNTALLLGVLYRDINEMDWRYKKIEFAGNGLNFVESKYLMENALNMLYSDDILNDRPRDRNKTYELEKSENYVINPSISKVTVGLGWDPSDNGKNIDVDGSVIIFKKNIGNNNIYKSEIVYYNNLVDKSGNFAKHHGDNLTGVGDGDDEKIDIMLHNIDNLSTSKPILCVVINIYKGASSFNSIKNCFARLLDDNGRELCRYTLSGQYNTKGMIMCSLHKQSNGCWSLIAHGIGCRGHVAAESVIDCIKVIKGDDMANTGCSCDCIIL